MSHASHVCPHCPHADTPLSTLRGASTPGGPARRPGVCAWRCVARDPSYVNPIHSRQTSRRFLPLRGTPTPQSKRDAPLHGGSGRGTAGAVWSPRGVCRKRRRRPGRQEKLCRGLETAHLRAGWPRSALQSPRARWQSSRASFKSPLATAAQTSLSVWVAAAYLGEHARHPRFKRERCAENPHRRRD